VNGWQFVVHQDALDTIDNLRPAERRAVRAALLQLVENPWQLPDGQIRPPNDRIYLVKNVGSLRVIYWLDAFARQVYIVRVDPPK
jgi:mRNA-degrading endonuclease RelE of RelBE toxin-antitoxin system